MWLWWQQYLWGLLFLGLFSYGGQTKPIERQLMKKLFLSLLTIFSLKADIFEINRQGFHFPHDKPMTMLYDTEKGFIAIHENLLQVIPPYNCSSELRDVTMEDIQHLLTHGYIRVHEADNGELRLEWHGRLKGGGPYLAYYFYWTTKTLCYGSLLGAAAVGGSAIIASTGGTATIPLATGLALGKAGIVSGAMSIGATTVASAVTSTTAGATLGTIAAGSAGTIVAAGGGSWGIIGAVETVSLLAGVAGAWIPWF